MCSFVYKYEEDTESRPRSLEWRRDGAVIVESLLGLELIFLVRLGAILKHPWQRSGTSSNRTYFVNLGFSIIQYRLSSSLFLR